MKWDLVEKSWLPETCCLGREKIKRWGMKNLLFLGGHVVTQSCLSRWKSRQQKDKPKKLIKSRGYGTSLVVQWVHLPMQETRVGSLVQEDSTCYRATKLASSNYWSLIPRGRESQLLSPCTETTEARVPQACAPHHEKPLQWEACAQQGRVAPACCS